MTDQDQISTKIRAWGVIIFLIETIAAIILGIILRKSPIEITKTIGTAVMILIPILAFFQIQLIDGFAEIVSAAVIYKYNSSLTSSKKKASAKSNTSGICPYCGKDLPVNASYCEHCGESFSKTNTSTPKKISLNVTSTSTNHKRCPECGEFVKSSVCDMCGKKNNLFD